MVVLLEKKIIAMVDALNSCYVNKRRAILRADFCVWLYVVYVNHVAYVCIAFVKKKKKCVH